MSSAPIRFKAVIASGNRHKFDELAELLTDPLSGSDVKLELVFGGDYSLGPGEIDENGSSYEENSLIKARTWAEFTGLPAIADDSGLEVLALGGAPGIYSARAAIGTDADRINWLLGQIDGCAERRARFVACVLIFIPGASDYFSATGTCEGTVARAPRGEYGFGYDPVFVPLGYEKTFAELGPSAKMKISHRAIAAKGMARMFDSVIKYASHCAN